MSKKSYGIPELQSMTPQQFRDIVRKGEFKGLTTDVCRNFGQANLVILPEEYAFEFLLFCNRNPRPCSLLDVTEPGDPHPKLVAPSADLRTDLPKYRVFRDGKIVDEPNDITGHWRDDLVCFLVGCSWSFDWSFKAANIAFRYTGDYKTNIPLIEAGRFHGHMVCSCRVFPTTQDAVKAIQISSRLIAFHGSPVHIGAPGLIGVNIDNQDAFKPRSPVVPVEPNEITIFWGCGVTPQVVALESKIPFMITHCPGYMFITDRLVEELASF